MTIAVHHQRKWLGVAVAAAFIGVVGFAGQAKAADPLVDVAWVKAHIGKSNVVFLDVRPQVAYLRGHIPGAVHTNYGKDGWRMKVGRVVGMMPSDTAKLAKLIGGLGIDNSSHVVLVSPGRSSTDMGISTRLFWTFKVLGDDNVSILNGGMAAYLAQVDKKGQPVNPLEKGMKKAEAKTFKVALRKDMLPDRNAVKAEIGKSGVTLVDNRPSDQYLGVTRPGVDSESGTIPSAHNVPQQWLTVNGGGTFRSKAELEKLYAAAGVPTKGKQINFCNTGHWASVGWFASSQILGNKKAELYDGSMSDWTHHNMPTEAKIKVN
jgi:thiosulfate/3-mercaptopyruvate sulfurtransferase